MARPFDIVFLVDTERIGRELHKVIRDAISDLYGDGTWQLKHGKTSKLRVKVCTTKSRCVSSTPFAASRDVLELQLDSICADFGKQPVPQGLENVIEEVLRIDGMPADNEPDIWRWHHVGLSVRHLFVLTSNPDGAGITDEYFERVVSGLERRRLYLSLYSVGRDEPFRYLETILEADRAEFRPLFNDEENRSINRQDLVDVINSRLEQANYDEEDREPCLTDVSVTD